MWPTDIFFAAMLLSAPVGSPAPLPAEAEWPKVQRVLREAARQLSLVDDDRLTRLLRERLDVWYLKDVNKLRRSWADLYVAPSKDDLHRFPDRKQAEEMVAFGQAYRSHLRKRLPFEQDREAIIEQAIEETGRSIDVWHCVAEAKRGQNPRGHLRAMKKLLGEKDYLTGKMPPPAPDWAFGP